MSDSLWFCLKTKPFEISTFKKGTLAGVINNYMTSASQILLSSFVFVLTHSQNNPRGLHRRWRQQASQEHRRIFTSLHGIILYKTWISRCSMFLRIQKMALDCLWKTQVCERLTVSWGIICGQRCLFINFGKVVIWRLFFYLIEQPNLRPAAWKNRLEGCW